MSAAEYAAWARSIAETGRAVSGDELGPDRTVIGPGGRSDLPEGVRLGGYFVLEADDGTEARRLAEAHPHLRKGGWVEVAPIVDREAGR